MSTTVQQGQNGLSLGHLLNEELADPTAHGGQWRSTLPNTSLQPQLTSFRLQRRPLRMGIPSQAHLQQVVGPSIVSVQRFQVLLTLFSKSFSHFVHTTCLLSVSEQCLAFAEVYLQIRTAFPNCPTPGTSQRYWTPARQG